MADEVLRVGESLVDYAASKPDSCKSCPLLDAPGPCWGSGDKERAKIVYVGQNPGKDEVATAPMQPFVGAAGRVLNRQLFEAKVRKDELFITNQVKCLTPGNRMPTGQEVQCCKPLLQKELDACKADTVVLAGDLAFQANLGGYSSIDVRYRPQGKLFSRMGCVERREGRKWIATIHPAAFFRALPPELKECPIDHLKKAWLIAGQKLGDLRIVEHPSDQEILEHVDLIMLQTREFADDVETAEMEGVEEDDYVGGDYQVTMCGFGGRANEALVVDPSQICLLAPIFADSTIERFEHNGQYDQYHLEKFFGVDNMRARTFDTILGTHWLRSIAPKKLKPYVLSQYTCLPYYQGFRSKDNLGKVSKRLYNGMDVITTFLAAKEIKRQLKQWSIYELYEELGAPLLSINEEWRRIGVNIDLRHAAFCKSLFTQRIAKAAEILAKIAGPMFAHTNHFHIKDLLYNKFKLPKQFKELSRADKQAGKEPGLTSDFEARKKLRRWIEDGRQDDFKIAYNALQLIDFVSGEEKKLQYISAISPDGRIHAFYKAYGTMVFRQSSSPNLQNWPVYSVTEWGGARRDDSNEENNPVAEDKEDFSREGGVPSLRGLIIPDNPKEDWILSCDFAQLQLWIYAWLADVKELKAIYEKNEYIYGTIYEKVYKEPYFVPGKPREKSPRHPDVSEQRMRRAKAVPLGFLFGRSAAAVAKEYQWTQQEANELRKWWFDLCPELQVSYNQTEYEMKQQGWIRHAFGQIIRYPEQRLTTAINNKAQTNEAFIVNESVIKIHNELRRRGLRQRGNRIMLTVHDSISLNVKQDDACEVYEEVVKPVLERPVQQLKGLVLRHSSEMSKRWDWDPMKWEKWKETYGRQAVSS